MMTCAERLALALFCALALAHAHKRAEMSPVPFTFAARYGRSPERLITPRHDRWMLTSRYGKRSSPELPDDQTPQSLFGNEPPKSPPFKGENETPLFLERGIDEPPFFKGGKGLKGSEAERLYCEYTGVLTLYHCSKRRLDDFEGRNDNSDQTVEV